MYTQYIALTEEENISIGKGILPVYTVCCTNKSQKTSQIPETIGRIVNGV